MAPARCAFLSSSLANVSNVPYVVALSLNACRVTVPSSRAAVSRAEKRVTGQSQTASSAR